MVCALTIEAPACAGAIATQDASHKTRHASADGLDQFAQQLQPQRAGIILQPPRGDDEPPRHQVPAPTSHLIGAVIPGSKASRSVVAIPMDRGRVAAILGNLVVQIADPKMKHVRRQIVTSYSVLKDFTSSDMSPCMFFLDFVVYPPIILVCLFFAFDHGGLKQWLESAMLIVSGFGSWTLIEYLAHRFVLHRVPVFSTLHKAHHDTPRALIGTPTVFSLVVFYCLAFWPIAELHGTRPAASWFAGILAGYSLYISVHFVVHHLGSGGFRFIKKLKRQHALHHHGEAATNFGVTTNFWDRVFGTMSTR